MRVRTLTAVLMLLVLLTAFMISAPVFSLEHPWDADNGSERPGKSGDGQDTVLVREDVPEGSDCPDWLWNLVYATSYYFPGQLVGFVADPAAN